MPDANGSRGEIGFAVQAPQAEVAPVEVKSRRNVAAKSLRSFMRAAGGRQAYRLSGLQFGVTPVEGLDAGLRSLPLYAAFCLDALGGRPTA